MINIACVLYCQQPGVLVRLIERRLLSVAALREMLGLAPAADVRTSQTEQTERLMQHDAYRRHKGRMVQTKWSA